MTDPRDDVVAATPPTLRAELEALDRAIRDAAPSLAVAEGSGGIGYGHYWYRYATGREGDWAVLSLVPRARNVSLYLGPGGVERWADRLPKGSCGKSCIRLKRASDLPPDVLAEIAELATRIDGKLLDWTGRNPFSDRPQVRDR